MQWQVLNRVVLETMRVLWLGFGLRLESGLGLGICHCLTRTRLLCQKEGGAKETERAQEKLGLRAGRKVGPLRRGTAGGGVGYWRLWRQECIGAFSVHSDAGWRLGRCNLGLNLSCAHMDHETQTH